MKVDKKLKDGRYIIEKDGIYFSLTPDQVSELQVLVMLHEAQLLNEASARLATDAKPTS